MLTLAGIAEIVVHVAGWPRLTALLVVVVGGHAAKVVVTGLITRGREERARERVQRAQSTVAEHPVVEPHR